MTNTIKASALVVTAFATIVFSASGQTYSHSSVRPVRTDVCHIVDHCQEFNGKRVSFRATVLSDGLEHSVLVDSKCKGGIVPYTSDQVDKHSDIQAFDNVPNQGRRGTKGKHITATFIGRFVCNPSESAMKRRVLQIEKIQDLNVTPREPEN